MRLACSHVALAMVIFAAPVAAQTTVDGINESATLTEKLFGASAIGWYYTPSSSFFLTAIKTRFATSPTFDINANQSRQVSVELWTDQAANGGSLLRSATFDSQLALNQFGGGAFSAFLLQGGTQYFIGFRNTSGLGRNSAEDPGSESLGNLYYSLGDPASASYEYVQAAHQTYHPSLQLQGRIPGQLDTTVTPEPVTMLLMATGLVGFGGVAAARRRRQQKQA